MENLDMDDLGMLDDLASSDGDSQSVSVRVDAGADIDAPGGHAAVADPALPAGCDSGLTVFTEPDEDSANLGSPTATDRACDAAREGVGERGADLDCGLRADPSTELDADGAKVASGSIGEPINHTEPTDSRGRRKNEESEAANAAADERGDWRQQRIDDYLQATLRKQDPLDANLGILARDLLTVADTLNEALHAVVAGNASELLENPAARVGLNDYLRVAKQVERLAQFQHRREREAAKRFPENGVFASANEVWRP